MNCFGHFCLRICSLYSPSPGYMLVSAPVVAELEQGAMAFHAAACAMSALCVSVHPFNRAPSAQLAGRMLAILPLFS